MPTSYQRRKREQAKAHRRAEAERRRRERAAEKKALERAQAWSKSYSLTDWRRRWKDRVDGIEVPHLPLPSDREVPLRSRAQRLNERLREQGIQAP